MHFLHDKKKRSDTVSVIQLSEQSLAKNDNRKSCNILINNAITNSSMLITPTTYEDVMQESELIKKRNQVAGVPT